MTTERKGRQRSRGRRRRRERAQSRRRRGRRLDHRGPRHRRARGARELRAGLRAALGGVRRRRRRPTRAIGCGSGEARVRGVRRAASACARARDARPDGRAARRALATRARDGGRTRRGAARGDHRRDRGVRGRRARVSRGLPPIAPDPTLDHAARLPAHGRAAVDDRAPPRGRSTRYLVTRADHGMNASTFTARVVASTGSDLVSAVVAAIGALKGPLHGGAPGPVLDMLDAVGRTTATRRAGSRPSSRAGRRIMGMGHRVYRVRDPRAAVLEAAIAAARGRAGRAAAARARARRRARRARAARASAAPRGAWRRTSSSTPRCCSTRSGSPRAQFTPTFASARVAGWCAHVLEQRRSGRLVRPALRYVGPQPEVAA